MSIHIRYLGAFFLSCGALLALAWFAAANGRIGYMPNQYVLYQDVRERLDRCDLGDLEVAGDSRMMAAVLPKDMPISTSLLSLGASSAAESYYTIDDVLSCARKPKLIVLSLALKSFSGPDDFWRFGATFGFLRERDLDDARRFSEPLGGATLFRSLRGDGLSDRLRVTLYAHSFPAFQFASMIDGLGVMRLRKNLQTRAAIEPGGHYLYGDAPVSHALNDDVATTAFVASPLIRAYLDRIVDRTARAGVPLIFVSVPMNETSYRALKPGVAAGFQSFMAAYARTHPGLHLLSPDVVPHWPDEDFGDAQHLNHKGAQRFTAEFSERLKSAGWLTGSPPV